MSEIDTHGMLIDFGRHKGEPYTRAPIAYLRWMVDSGHTRMDVAVAELERRGMPLVKEPIEISGHAIDSASLRCWKIYRDNRKTANQGLHAWLITVCVDALASNDLGADSEVYHLGMKLAFHKGGLHMTLKTVMRDKRK